MEEPTSILLHKGIANGAGIIQESQHINGHALKATPDAIRLIEAESKLNRVFEEYSGRIESFMLMLDALKEGVVIINKAGEVCYANELGNAMLSNDSLHIEISKFLSYKELGAEENITVQNDLQQV